MKEFTTREEILQDAINYYWGKPERKCVDLGTARCQYEPSATSEGCAIGRLVDLETAKMLDMLNCSIDVDVQFEKLPEWLKKMGQDFLFALQSIHDGSKLAKCDEYEIKKHMRRYVDISKIVFPSVDKEK